MSKRLDEDFEADIHEKLPKEILVNASIFRLHTEFSVKNRARIMYVQYVDGQLCNWSNPLISEEYKIVPATINMGGSCTRENIQGRKKSTQKAIDDCLKTLSKIKKISLQYEEKSKDQVEEQEHKVELEKRRQIEINSEAKGRYVKLRIERGLLNRIMVEGKEYKLHTITSGDTVSISYVEYDGQMIDWNNQLISTTYKIATKQEEIERQERIQKNIEKAIKVEMVSSFIDATIYKTNVGEVIDDFEEKLNQTTLNKGGYLTYFHKQETHKQASIVTSHKLENKSIEEEEANKKQILNTIFDNEIRRVWNIEEDNKPKHAAIDKGALFRGKLSNLLDEFGKEKEGHMPNFILAEYIEDCLMAFDKAEVRRVMWYKPEKISNEAVFHENTEQ